MQVRFLISCILVLDRTSISFRKIQWCADNMPAFVPSSLQFSNKSDLNVLEKDSTVEINSEVQKLRVPQASRLVLHFQQKMASCGLSIYILLTALTVNDAVVRTTAYSSQLNEMIVYLTKNQFPRPTSGSDYESYGCWCNVLNRQKDGEIVDDIDACCHRHYNCYKRKSSSSMCDPYGTEYDSYLHNNTVSCTNTDGYCHAFLRPPSHPTITCTKPKWNKNGITVAGNGTFGSSSIQLAKPMGIFIDQDDHLYVTDNTNHRIQKFVQGSNVGITIAGSNTRGNASNQLSYPQDIFIDSLGNLFVTDMLNRRIQKWSVNNSREGITVAALDPNYAPYGIFGNKQGDIYVSGEINYRGKLTKYSNNFEVATTIASDYSSVWGLFVDECDDIYAAFYQSHYIQKLIDQLPLKFTVAGVKAEKGSDSTHLGWPSDILFDPYGNLYISDKDNHRIQRLKADDDTLTMETIAGVTEEQGDDTKHFNEPWSIAFDSKYNLYVSDMKNHRVQKFLFESGDLYC
ncbi:unnamed protein product [Didymodactylos carnosus]|uniref:Phospholipase A2-like central domain-containing protein n=2 Tax=Didymodactylos carnosus TaxID=1234261 RepID=A0A814RPC4_9BILA|nr:unnamed protein product [Didymodactylos carnosus]CAF3899750.1 unnamed protein product [Didymodactylos carnosus]